MVINLLLIKKIINMDGLQNFTKHIYSNISVPQHIDNINILVSFFCFIYNIIILNKIDSKNKTYKKFL